ncbi:MAG: hypothetical protein K0S57_1359 [Ramlibacter sp.]|jgi:hypothetical protein|nr:hypothetical protein [Ramlibacter sp.]
MRIDVDLDHRDVEAELAALYGRLRLRADKLVTLPIFAPRAPELVFKYREVDGEFYVYAEDVERGVLAGCTVFNWVFEVDPRVGRFVRSPHSRYAREYRRKGVANAVYRWALQAGMCLVSGPRQSAGAYRLWTKLGGSYEIAFVQLIDRGLHVVGPVLQGLSSAEFGTRMLLLGAGWAVERFEDALG